jgi:hypothetical protein
MDGPRVTVKLGDFCDPAGITTLDGTIAVFADTLLDKLTAMPPVPAIGCEKTVAVSNDNGLTFGPPITLDQSPERYEPCECRRG